MKRMKMIALLFMAAAVLSGCASTGLVMKNTDLDGQKEVNMLIEPFQSLGLSEAEEIKNGNIAAVWGIFPDILFGEYYPGRIRWNVWAVSEDGTEGLGQMLFSGIDFSGHFAETIIASKSLRNPKVLVLSTTLDFVYDLAGNEYPVERVKFLNNTDDYRRKMVQEKGTRLNETKKATGISEVIKKWNRYQTPRGILLSPLSEEDVKTVAGINPQYSFSERLVGSGQFAISLDYIGTAAGFAIDIFRAANGSVPSLGWDYNSQIPTRRNMAFIIKYVSEMKQRLIDRINQANAKIVIENTKTTWR